MNATATDECDTGAAATFVALMYHNIFSASGEYCELSPSATSYFVPSDALEKQLGSLEGVGGACVSWDALESHYHPGACPREQKLSSKFPVLFTFDDGWKGAIELGGPILAQHQAQALFFVTTDFIDRPHMVSRADLSKIDPAVFRVGSHGRTHRMLSLLNRQEIRRELEDSKKNLEDIVGYKIDTLSIPSGAVNAQVRQLATECGYRFVFDSEPRVNYVQRNQLAIGRVAVTKDTSLSSFLDYVQQRVTGQRLRRALLEGPKRILGLRRYETLRRWFLHEKAGQQVTHES